MDEEDLAPDGELGEGAAGANEPENDQPISVEELAAEMGHTPREKWRGDPDEWKPAADFLKTTGKINKSLNNRLKGMEDQISNMARTSAVLTEQALADQREKLLAERDEAIDMGDRAAVDKADAKLNTLNVTIKRPVEPEVTAFTERNEWFEKDTEATAWAINRADELARTGIGTTRQLAIVEREAKQLFPELFPAEKPKPKAADLNAPGNRGSTRQGKSLSDLPPASQAMIKEYAAKGICTVEDGVKAFFEEQGA